MTKIRRGTIQRAKGDLENVNNQSLLKIPGEKQERRDHLSEEPETTKNKEEKKRKGGKETLMRTLEKRLKIPVQ